MKPSERSDGECGECGTELDCTSVGSVMLSKRERYHYTDGATNELKLIQVGHYLWTLYKRARNGGDVGEREALGASLETVWELKRQVRAELKIRRAARSEAMR